ncbi:tryptophan--tRNA ligase [bacterium J17]|nr:tryptophan--tRNA ligase [bacterium J17]
MSTKFKERVFSGVQPSGEQVHIGNYLGAMRRFVSLAEDFETIICLVDLHALTSVTSPNELRSYSESLVASYLAIGLDPEKITIFRQSDVPQVCELTWYLACNFPLGLLERAHALKDARGKNVAANAGLMFYPILMAADILLYRASKIPVGADQKQHLEMTRDVAQRFNTHYGELFPIPEPLIDEDTGVIPGLDGRKMSKSYDNYIGLFESSKTVKKKIMRIVTDSKTVEEKKDPEPCNIFNIYRLFAQPQEIEDLASRYREGGMGYGEAKLALYEAVERELAPLRESYEGWIQRKDDLGDILRQGANKALEIASPTIEDVRKAIGVA